jgi:hypothetical protein
VYYREYKIEINYTKNINNIYYLKVVCNYQLLSSMSIIGTNEPSIFIPHVFSNTSERVEDVFVELFGRSTIDRVDIVRHTDDVCRAYVHFTCWPTTPEGRKLREKLISGETVKVVYSEPRFWKCVASTINKPRQEQSSVPRGPYIEVDDMIVKCIDSRGGGGRMHPQHQQHQRTHTNPNQRTHTNPNQRTHSHPQQHHHHQYQSSHMYNNDGNDGNGGGYVHHHMDSSRSAGAPMRRVPFHSGGGYQEQPQHGQQQRRHQIKPAKNFKNKKWVRSDGEDTQTGECVVNDSIESNAIVVRDVESSNDE